ncbi:hypothetical protein E4U53_000003 [Claviceps sorghi]|nr:hypothetical protein E4U53_000003 [Claviceps sorghi]
MKVAVLLSLVAAYVVPRPITNVFARCTGSVMRIRPKALVILTYNHGHLTTENTCVNSGWGRGIDEAFFTPHCKSMGQFYVFVPETAIDSYCWG